MTWECSLDLSFPFIIEEVEYLLLGRMNGSLLYLVLLSGQKE